MLDMLVIQAFRYVFRCIDIGSSLPSYRPVPPPSSLTGLGLVEPLHVGVGVGVGESSEALPHVVPGGVLARGAGCPLAR